MKMMKILRMMLPEAAPTELNKITIADQAIGFTGKESKNGDS
jgi:hypothetical protein